jgi:Zn-finger nucleic acid-binding protein
LDRVNQGAGYELLLLEKAEGVKTYRGSEHPCPQCKTTLLYRHFFSRKHDTEVNQCAKCSGFWVDVGGLSKIVQSKNEEKQKLLKEYFTVIMDEKISGMNHASTDLAQAAKMITTIFNFLSPKYK